MSAPAFTTRQAPAEAKLEDGWQTNIIFSDDPDISIYEDSIQAPGIELPELIDTTTQLNVAWQTFAIHSLKRLTESNVTAGYAAASYPQLIAMIGTLQAVTIHFPNDYEMAFWGVLRSALPNALERAGFPTVALLVGCTNTDTAGAEEGPVFQQGSGT